MAEFFESLGPIGVILLNGIGAIAILLIGWIIARLIAGGVRRLLERTDIDNRISKALANDGQAPKYDVEDITARVVFWIIMLFVLVAVLQQLELPAVAQPINDLLEQVTTVYIPNLLGAALLGAVAWAIATALKFLTTRALNMARLDERLTEHAAIEEGEQVSVAQSLATAVFWFVFLLFLPPILTALGIEEVAAPVQDMFERALSFIPNILGAGLILLIGWFIARIIRQVVTNLLAAVGVDRFGENLNLTDERSISKLVGLFIYTFVLLFTIISALEELDIAAISDPATLMLSTIINTIPNIIGAVLVLTISYYIGRLVGNLVSDLLEGLGADTWPERIGIRWAGTVSVPQFVGYIILVSIMLFAAISSAELLGSEALSGIIATFASFIWQLVLALIILAIGLYLANLAKTVILTAGGARADLMASLARFAILILAGAMGLRQIGVAEDIVNLAFGILLGAVGIATALAFGLGSREVAGREVERLVRTLRKDDSPAE